MFSLYLKHMWQVVHDHRQPKIYLSEIWMKKTKTFGAIIIVQTEDLSHKCISQISKNIFYTSTHYQ